MADVDLLDSPTVKPETAGRPRLTVVLLAIIAVAVLASAVAVGHVWGTSGRATPPSPTSVDAGFASDMSAHHAQAITMAGYERDHTTNPNLKALAFDIETSQLAQEGEMLGWLDSWGLVRNSSNTMSWMGGSGHLESDGLMPGMATAAQMATLQSSTGTALDVLFLQLMIHHHQGGVTMAHYAALHAKESYVRTVAQAMYVAQSNEIVQMEQILRTLGASPLPAPN